MQRPLTAITKPQFATGPAQDAKGGEEWKIGTKA